MFICTTRLNIIPSTTPVGQCHPRRFTGGCPVVARGSASPNNLFERGNFVTFIDNNRGWIAIEPTTESPFKERDQNVALTNPSQPRLALWELPELGENMGVFWWWNHQNTPIYPLYHGRFPKAHIKFKSFCGIYIILVRVFIPILLPRGKRKEIIPKQTGLSASQAQKHILL